VQLGSRAAGGVALALHRAIELVDQELVNDSRREPSSTVCVAGSSASPIAVTTPTIRQPFGVVNFSFRAADVESCRSRMLGGLHNL
jgi:hypothetical protein